MWINSDNMQWWVLLGTYVVVVSVSRKIFKLFHKIASKAWWNSVLNSILPRTAAAWWRKCSRRRTPTRGPCPCPRLPRCEVVVRSHHRRRPPHQSRLHSSWIRDFPGNDGGNGECLVHRCDDSVGPPHVIIHSTHCCDMGRHHRCCWRYPCNPSHCWCRASEANCWMNWSKSHSWSPKID